MVATLDRHYSGPGREQISRGSSFQIERICTTIEANYGSKVLMNLVPIEWIHRKGLKHGLSAVTLSQTQQ